MSGLLSSLCVFPLLSYGSTAPLADLPTDPSSREAAIARGWEEAPVGRQRLNGSDSDPEDNVLKEWLVAQALLERTRTAAGGLPLRAADELGCLQVTTIVV
jgi:hypothetical protein